MLKLSDIHFIPFIMLYLLVVLISIPIIWMLYRGFIKQSINEVIASFEDASSSIETFSCPKCNIILASSNRGNFLIKWEKHLDNPLIKSEFGILSAGYKYSCRTYKIK